MVLHDTNLIQCVWCEYHMYLLVIYMSSTFNAVKQPRLGRGLIFEYAQSASKYEPHSSRQRYSLAFLHLNNTCLAIYGVYSCFEPRTPQQELALLSRLTVNSTILARPIARPSQPLNQLLNLFPCFRHDIQPKELRNEEDKPFRITVLLSIAMCLFLLTVHFLQHRDRGL